MYNPKDPPPPPPGGSAHFCLLPIINFLPRLTMLTPKDIEGQFICSDVILRQVRPDAVITAATLGVKLREPVWALWGSMHPLGTPSTTIPVTLLAARGEVVTGPRTKANPGLVEVRYKQEKGKTFWHPLRDILPMEQLPPGFFCTERRLLWLARPGRKALARQAFLGRGGSPKSSSIAG